MSSSDAMWNTPMSYGYETAHQMFMQHGIYFTLIAIVLFVLLVITAFALAHIVRREKPCTPAPRSFVIVSRKRIQL